MRINISHLGIIFLAGLLLTGCATETSSISSNYKLQNSTSKGLIAVNVTFYNIPYVIWLKFAFRKTDTNYNSSIYAMNMCMKEYWIDYYEEKEKGRLVIVELDSGEYEFYSWSGSMGGWGGLRRLKPGSEFSYKFFVTAGKITYIGNIYLAISGLSKLSVNQKLPAKVIIRDRSDDDIPFIFSTHSALNKNDLIVNITLQEWCEIVFVDRCGWTAMFF